MSAVVLMSAPLPQRAAHCASPSAASGLPSVTAGAHRHCRVIAPSNGARDHRRTTTQRETVPSPSSGSTPGTKAAAAAAVAALIVVEVEVVAAATLTVDGVNIATITVRVVATAAAAAAAVAVAALKKAIVAVTGGCPKDARGMRTRKAMRAQRDLSEDGRSAGRRRIGNRGRGDGATTRTRRGGDCDNNSMRSTASLSVRLVGRKHATACVIRKLVEAGRGSKKYATSSRKKTAKLDEPRDFPQPSKATRELILTRTKSRSWPPRTAVGRLKECTARQCALLY